jgi:hypothetical protein
MYSSRRQAGPPAWFVFIIGFALVFGAFRLWTGVQEFFRAGGIGLPTSTPQSVEQAIAQTATPVSNLRVTAVPTITPIPTCQNFIVQSNSGVVNVRAQPSTVASVLETVSAGQSVCVLERQGEWYLVDRDTRTRRIEEGYIFNNLLESANPTPTPSDTSLPPSTVTLTPTPTATLTPTVIATR